MNNKKYIIPLIALLTLSVAVVSVFVFNSDDEEITTTFNAEFEDEQSQTENKVENEAASSSIEIPGYSTVYVQANEKTVEVDFYNPDSNSVYFQITLTIADTDEVIYTSKLFSPGQHLYEIELERDLEKGEYEIILAYSTYSMDDEYTPKNGANVSFTLVAE